MSIVDQNTWTRGATDGLCNSVVFVVVRFLSRPVNTEVALIDKAAPLLNNSTCQLCGHS